MNGIYGRILPQPPQPWRAGISSRRPGRQGAPRLPALASPACSSHPGQQCSSVLWIYSSPPGAEGLHRPSGSRLPPGIAASSRPPFFCVSQSPRGSSTLGVGERLLRPPPITPCSCDSHGRNPGFTAEDSRGRAEQRSS